MGQELVEKILGTSGQPVAGHTLSFEEVKQAVEEGRVLQAWLWSSPGKSEASFDFATSIGLDSEGRLHSTYLVFPKPIPEELRFLSSSNWEEIDEVFAAFGVEQS